jgi:hypothetical protein
MSDDVTRSQTEIRRWLAESDKFVAEQRKLMAEASKLDSERRKYDRERWTPIILSIAAAFGAFAGALSVLSKIMGWG